MGARIYTCVTTGDGSNSPRGPVSGYLPTVPSLTTHQSHMTESLSELTGLSLLLKERGIKQNTEQHKLSLGYGI